MLSLICIVDNLKLIWKLNSANNWKTTGEFKFSNSTILRKEREERGIWETINTVFEGDKKKRGRNVANREEETDERSC